MSKSTKENILMSSFRLFLQKGYKNTTMSQLVKVSGVSKGAFYHYFSSKEELFDHALEQYFYALASPVINFEADAERTFMENFQGYLYTRNQAVEKMRQELEIDFNANYTGVVMEAMQLFEHHKKRSLELLDEELLTYQNIILLAQQSGELRADVEAELLAKHLYFMLDGFKLHVMVLGDLNTEVYTQLNGLLQQFYTLIKNPSFQV